MTTMAIGNLAKPFPVLWERKAKTVRFFCRQRQVPCRVRHSCREYSLWLLCPVLYVRDRSVAFSACKRAVRRPVQRLVQSGLPRQGTRLDVSRERHPEGVSRTSAPRVSFFFLQQVTLLGQVYCMWQDNESGSCVAC